MDINIKIDDERIKTITQDAKNELFQQVEQYVEEIIREANLIEEGNREPGANVEVTSSIIKQAVRKYRNNTTKKKDRGLIVMKVGSVFSLLLTGFLFDAQGYQDNIVQLILFIVCLVLSCVFTVLQFVKEG